MGRDAAFFSVTSQQLKNGSRDINVPDILKSVTPGTFFTASPTCLCPSEVRRQGLLSVAASWSSRTKSERGRRSLGSFSKGCLAFGNSKQKPVNFRGTHKLEKRSWSERGKVGDCQYVE